MAERNFTYEDFLTYKNVSRETFLRLQNYVTLLQKWQKKINLVSGATVSDIWIRHIIDSTQIYDFIQESGSVADIGSGAGFPGLVLAILGIQTTLVESDARKAAFLREAARVTQANATVLNQRVEAVSFTPFTTITARALSTISGILDLLSPTIGSNHKLLLLKGKTYREELAQARKRWNFECTVTPSVTDAAGVIIHLQHCTARGEP